MYDKETEERIVDIITKEYLKELKPNVEGYGIIYLDSYQQMTGSNGKYFRGKVRSKIEGTFMVWGGTQAFDVLNNHGEDIVGQVVEIRYKTKEFGGNVSMHIDMIKPVEGYDIDMFLEHKYDKGDLQRQFLSFIKKNLSENGKNLLINIFNSQDDKSGLSLWEIFSEEFAAMSHHDNCPSGLLAHTLKVLLLTKTCVEMYDWFGKSDIEADLKDEKELDLIYISAMLHDIGKVYEMNNGIYQRNTFTTHRIIGVEMLMPFKGDFIALYGERGWNLIVSVIVGHHDQYGDPARSIYAYVIHKIDSLDAMFTQMGQSLQSEAQETTAGKSIKYDNHYLYIE